MRIGMSAGSLLLLPLLLCAAAVHASLLDEPLQRWSVDLPSGLQRGNALVAASSSRLVAATESGSLHVLDTDGNVLINYDPTRNDPLTCASGVAIQGNLAIYSVYNGGNDSSDVIAIDWTDGSIGWMVTVEGQAVGTPMLGQNGVYVIHNSEGAGRLSVLEGWSVRQSFPAPEEGSIGPLAPGALQTVQGFDVVVMAESRDDGFSKSGRLYMLIEEEPRGNGPGAAPGAEPGTESTQVHTYRWALASDFPRSSVTAPAFTADMEVFLPQQGGLLSAWVDKRDLSGVFSGNAQDVTPRWERFLAADEDNGDAPLLSTPQLNGDESLLFVAGAGPLVYSIQMQQGKLAWFQPITGKVVASPVLNEVGENEDDHVVYFMEETGRLRSYSISSGDLLWQQNMCGDDCGSVHADFVLSESGNMVVFADNLGRVVSLSVAAFATEAPSMAPSLASSVMPSNAPVVPSSNPSLTPSLSLSLTPSARVSVAPSENSEVIATDPPSQAGDTATGSQAGDTTVAPTTDDKVNVNRGDVSGLDNGPPASSTTDPSMLYIGIAAGGVFLVCVLGILYICCRRKGRFASEKTKELNITDDAKWSHEKDAYAKECDAAEKETLNAIVGTTGKPSSNASVSDSLTGTPQTALASIAETPDDIKGSDGMHDEDFDEEIGFEMSISEDTPSRSKSPTYSNSVPEFTMQIKQQPSFESAATPSVGGETRASASIAGYSDVQSVAGNAASADSKNATPHRANGMHASAILQNMVRSEKRSSKNTAPLADSTSDELAAATSAIPGLANALSDDEEEPGRIRVGSRKKSEPQPSPNSPVRAVSPVFSDVLSVDGSLYYDDSTIGTYSKRECPDDESSRVSYGLSSLLFGSTNRAKTPTPTEKAAPVAALDRPQATAGSQPTLGPLETSSLVAPVEVPPQKEPQRLAVPPQPEESRAAVPLKPANPAPKAATIEDTQKDVLHAAGEAPRKPQQPQPLHGPPRDEDAMEPRMKPTRLTIAQSPSSGSLDSGKGGRKLSHAGVSVRRGRSRAGLFTRRNGGSSNRSMELSDPMTSPPEITPDGGTVSEVEELAYTAPGKRVTHSKEDKQGEQMSKTEKGQQDSTEDAWNSFLNELSKAEDAFFSPEKQHPNSEEVPRLHSRSPSPPPPPPPRA